MNLSVKIKWLLTSSGITTYKISKDLNESTQFLDRYKNDPEKIGGMRLEKAEKLLSYIENLSREDVFQNAMTNQQILIEGASEEEIKEFFKRNRFAIALNWVKAHKDMFIVNFEIYSNKTFNKYPYNLSNLCFITGINQSLKEKFADYIRACGKRIELVGSKVLHEIDGKTYQIVYTLNKPSALKAINLIDVIETDTYIDGLSSVPSDEESLLNEIDL